jgi:phosphopantothenoylcysteine decarboxylase / phosphopantothenate---cysteine ligase
MNVLLGVTGGIAAYKACELVRRLREGGHEVQVVMTEAATHFVTPMTFEVLSGRPVGTSLWGGADPSIEHIRLARWPDVIAIAPATANTLGRLAHGLAEDLLSTVVLASLPHVPVVLAPAMNTAMWENPLVQANVRTLSEVDEGRRYRFVTPSSKQLACGEVGIGALAEEPRILAAIVESAPAAR